MIEAIQQYCLSKPLVEECLPFGPENLVFKVAGKMFLLVSLDAEPLRLNAKNTPEKNEQLRETYTHILPGYHMNKQHWNTIVVATGITWPLVTELIDESYQIVCNSLPKKIREQLIIK